MKPHILDNPIWHALHSHQSMFSLGGDLAKCYQPDVAPFVATQHEEPANISALNSLIKNDEVVYLLGSNPPLSRGLKVEAYGICAQMVWQGSAIADEGGQNILQLSAADVPEMLALTAVAFPGYFRPRTYAMGDYFGVCQNGVLIAMAGERMSMPGYQEISAVCTHPDFRGQGHARRLVNLLVNRMRQHGTTPFLHADDENETAKRLYVKLGFVERRKLPLWRIIREKVT